MGEGEDERPANFDEILEVSGLDAEQVRHWRRNLVRWTWLKPDLHDI